MGFDVGEADRLLMTTRSVRRRLDRDQPVPLSVVRNALTVAVQTPTSGGRQDWRWLVVTDPASRAAIGEVYRRACDTVQRPGPRHDAEARSADVFTEHLGEVPDMPVPDLARILRVSQSTVYRVKRELSPSAKAPVETVAA